MTCKMIDLFAGIGGIRLGFERAFDDTQTVFVSEIDAHARATYAENFCDSLGAKSCATLMSACGLSRRPSPVKNRRCRRVDLQND